MSENTTEAEKLKEELFMNNEHTAKVIDDAEMKEAFDFCESYKSFLNSCKTEREAAAFTVKEAEKRGFVPFDKNKHYAAGDKVYYLNRKKAVILAVIGKKSVGEGVRIAAAHIDSPRLDLKPNPLYEDTDIALFKTHYYGGIKKYQWATIPMSLHGVVVKRDGSETQVNIGENEGDPQFVITDLLPHLAASQMSRKPGEIIKGEELNILVGSLPFKRDSGSELVKLNIMKILNEKYGIKEEDFLSAEIEVVPAGPSRDYGLDRSMVAGYGHDDRVCAYTSLRAILDIAQPEYTACCILVDKEEIGSVGATGAQSVFFENRIADLLALQNETSYIALKKTMENCRMLSSDVSAGFDPLFPEVNDSKNAAYLNRGIVFNKYTGARGKSGSNDAMPEYMAWIRKICDDNNLYFQTAELGKVDQGGGGTIAYILGNYNMNVIDAGISVLNMHAPMEIVAKADVYEAYLVYKAFLLG